MSEEIECPYGYEECDPYEYELSCDECRNDAAEHLADMWNDRD